MTHTTNHQDEDAFFIRLAHQHRLKLTPPSQSNFRVVAIICYEGEDDVSTSTTPNSTTTSQDLFPIIPEKNADKNCLDVDVRNIDNDGNNELIDQKNKRTKALRNTTTTATTTATTAGRSDVSLMSLPLHAAPLTSSNSTTSCQRYVIGTNDEPGANICGAICAERAALLQLRFVAVRRIVKLWISTDALNPIAPGMMCREFLSGHGKVPYNLPITLIGSACQNCQLDISFPQASSMSSQEALEALQAPCQCRTGTLSTSPINGGSSNDETAKFHSFKLVRATLDQLYPFPSLYANLTAQESDHLGSHLQSTNRNTRTRLEEAMVNYRQTQQQTETAVMEDAAKMNFPNTSSLFTTMISLVDLAIQEARRQHQRDHVDRPLFLHHPITFGAAVLFNDGTMASAAQKKALEYGCTLDAVCQLAYEIDTNDGESSPVATPVVPISLKQQQNHNQTQITPHSRKPILLVQSDQYGVVHPPFAPARAFLSEHGHGLCHVIVDKNSDAAVDLSVAKHWLVLASDLAPLAPDNCCNQR